MDSKQHTQPSGTVIPKPRIEFVDLAKGFCIILVVLFHLQLYMAYYTPFDWMARSFRMPLYFILSGLFFKEYEGFLGFLKRKTNKLLIPFLAFYLLSNLVLPFLGSLVGLCSFDWKMPFAFFLERSWPNVAIWFLWCLSWEPWAIHSARSRCSCPSSGIPPAPPCPSSAWATS